MMYFLPLFVAENYFEEDMVMACAIVVSGFECGLMSFGPLIQFFLNVTSWRWAMRFLAFISLSGLFGAIVYTPIKHGNLDDTETRMKSITCQEFRSDLDQNNSQTEVKDHDVKKNTYQSIENDTIPNGTESNGYKTDAAQPFDQISTDSSKSYWVSFTEYMQFYGRGDFILFAAAFFCFEWAYVCPYAYIPLRAQLRGISDSDSSYLLTIFGACGIGVRLLLLFVKMEIKGLVLSTGFAIFIAGLASLLMPICKIYATMAIYSGVLGVSLGELNPKMYQCSVNCRRMINIKTVLVLNVKILSKLYIDIDSK